MPNQDGLQWHSMPSMREMLHRSTKMPYRIPYSRREAVKGELDKMLAESIIRPSTSPWAS